MSRKQLKKSRSTGTQKKGAPPPREVTNEELEGAVRKLALGRILRLASRPEEPGDAEEYERCRALILDVSDDLPPGWDKRPVFARFSRSEPGD